MLEAWIKLETLEETYTFSAVKLESQWSVVSSDYSQTERPPVVSIGMRSSTYSHSRNTDCPVRNRWLQYQFLQGITEPAQRSGVEDWFYCRRTPPRAKLASKAHMQDGRRYTRKYPRLSGVSSLKHMKWRAVEGSGPPEASKGSDIGSPDQPACKNSANRGQLRAKSRTVVVSVTVTIGESTTILKSILESILKSRIG